MTFNKNRLQLILANSYFILPIWSAVLSRYNQPKQDPLVNIFGGWSIIEFKYTFDFAFIWNILMFAPMFICIYYLLKTKNRELKLYKISISSVFISFAYSGIIEGLQILFRVGTFQISDLVYNTLGALIGSIITIIIIKRRCH